MKKTNTVVHNFLTNDEVLIVNEIVMQEIEKRETILAEDNGHFLNYSQKDFSIITKEMGRITLREIKLPESIISKFNNLASQIAIDHGYSKPTLEARPVFTEYSLKYGEPKLPPHLDLGKSNFLLDYQLYSNFDWGLTIDNDYYPKIDNDVANIFNKNQIHYRPFRLFNQNEKLGVLFFNYYIRGMEESTFTQNDLHESNKNFNHDLRRIKESAGMTVDF